MPATIAIESGLRERFNQLKDEWKVESEHLSNTAQMAMLWSYQQIIGIGSDAVPLILMELQHETDHWFWALEAITGVNPVPAEAAGNVSESAKAWIQWGRERGFVLEDA